MLRSFLESIDNNEEVLSTSKKAGNFVNNALRVLSTDEAYDAQMDHVMDQILECESDEELTKLQSKFVDLLVEDKIAPDGTIRLNVKSISKALGYSTSIISFASSTTNDILALINLEAEISLYQQNIEFLENIAYNESATYAMRVAAYSLLDDIENKYKKITEDILLNVFTFSKDTYKILTNFNVWKSIFKDTVGGNISQALLTYKLSVFISNLAIDTEDFVKQTAYTQGYAQLSSIYSEKLKQDRQDFLSNKSKDNAWQFFEDYTILWQLRYNGEEQYEKAQHVKSFFGLIDGVNLKYIYKLSVIQSNLDSLNDAKFNVSKDVTIPSSVQYMKKAVVHCPVDVKVYTSDGKFIVNLKDGVESDVTNSYGRFAVVYNPCIDEYEKVICQITNKDLNIEIIGNSSGFVDYEIAKSNSIGKADISVFTKESINKNDIIKLTTDSSKSYSIDYDGDNSIDVTKNLTKLKEYSDINNKCGNDVYYNFKNGILTIYGYGDMYDYKPNKLDASMNTSIQIDKNGNQSNTNYSGKYEIYSWDKKTPWYDVRDNITSIKVVGNINNIGNYAFVNCNNVTDISLSNSIQNIGENAFTACYSLESLKLPNSLKKIGKDSFYYCFNLKTLIVPESLKTISKDLFSTCYNLNRIFGYSSVSKLYDNDIFIDIETVKMGDMNLDGNFNVADAVMLQKWMLAQPVSSCHIWEKVDYNNDGKLDVFDLVLMKQALLAK